MQFILSSYLLSIFIFIHINYQYYNQYQGIHPHTMCYKMVVIVQIIMLDVITVRFIIFTLFNFIIFYHLTIFVSVIPYFYHLLFTVIYSNFSLVFFISCIL